VELLIEHTRVIIRRSRDICLTRIGGAKLYDLRSVRSCVEVANGLDPFCDGFFKIWWACNSCGYTTAPIVPRDEDLNRQRADNQPEQRVAITEQCDGAKFRLTCVTFTWLTPYATAETPAVSLG
jgi:hypothetical protein